MAGPALEPVAHAEQHPQVHDQHGFQGDWPPLTIQVLRSHSDDLGRTLIARDILFEGEKRGVFKYSSHSWTLLCLS